MRRHTAAAHNDLDSACAVRESDAPQLELKHTRVLPMYAALLHRQTSSVGEQLP